jgi:hypothetical protein
MNLPWEEREVDVFTYLSVFSEEQKKEISSTSPLRTMDEYKTTDEMIKTIAEKKQELANGLFEIVQSAAVDCELHYYEHGAVTKCFKFAESDNPFYLHPDWRVTLQRNLF